MRAAIFVISQKRKRHVRCPSTVTCCAGSTSVQMQIFRKCSGTRTGPIREANFPCDCSPEVEQYKRRKLQSRSSMRINEKIKAVVTGERARICQPDERLFAKTIIDLVISNAIGEAHRHRSKFLQAKLPYAKSCERVLKNAKSWSKWESATVR